MGRARFPQAFPNVCFLLRGVPAGNGSFIPGSGAPSELPCHAPSLTLHLSVWVSQVVLVVKNPSVSAGDVRDLGLIPGSGRPPQEGTATHSSILAWEIPWTEEPGGLQSTGSQRVGHN